MEVSGEVRTGNEAAVIKVVVFEGIPDYANNGTRLTPDLRIFGAEGQTHLPVSAGASAVTDGVHEKLARGCTVQHVQ